MMKAFIYLRVSTPRQDREGLSISRDDDPGFQELRCRELCKFKGWEVHDEIFKDGGITGRRKGAKKRDGLAAATRAACEGKGVLVVYAVARLGRSAGYIHNMADALEDAGANIASVCEPIDTSTAMGRAFFGVTAVFAQLESDQLSERMRAAHKFLRDEYGYNPIGPAPYGYAKDGMKRVPNPAEQAVLKAARRFRRDGLSFSRVARALNAQGYRTRQEGEWHAGSVQRILARKKIPASRVCPTRQDAAS